MFGLLINPKPMCDESLVGYLHRLGRSNGLLNGELIKLFKKSSDERVSEWLSEFSRPASWPSMTKEIRHPKNDNMKVWSVTHLKYCPVCLAEAAYWRESWGLALATTCSIHKVGLQYQCSNCLLRIGSSALLTQSCGCCGHSLIETNTSASVADEQRLWITKLLEDRLLMNGRSYRKEFELLSYEQLHTLAMRIGVRSAHRESRKPMKLAATASLEIAPALAQAAGQVLMNWPQGFQDLLSDLRAARERGSSWKLPTAFGPIYRDIYNELSEPCFDFLRAEFESYVIQEWDAPLARRNRNLSAIALRQYRWVSLKEASKITKLPASFLRRMQISEELDVRTFTYGSGKVTTVVNIDHVRQLSPRMRDPLNLKETAHLLCISEDRVRQLLNAGILKTIGQVPHRGEKWFIDFDSISSLIPRSFGGEPGLGFVSVSYFAKHYLPTTEGFPALMRAIQSGEVPAVCVGNDKRFCIGKWLINPIEVKHLNEEIPQMAGHAAQISVVDAAKLLGVKQEVGYALVRLGLLRSVTVECGRRVARMVRSNAINRFNKNYILAPEMLTAMGTTSCKYVREYLRRNGFKPVAGPTLVSAQCRQYVWKRSKRLLDCLALVADR
ncbi:TniQ family protein [Pseudomonas sp. GM17]|uniref:TniQ family protein n=1 Tax=Pseudomonas sp. GM17 TaxID=1144323 RepID=UPI0024DFBAC2|nr:TniQ family protein [Pseudomonas sp. GM17]WIE50653.1 TniQ family protein [Pseudomonas sp. GM17]